MGTGTSNTACSMTAGVFTGGPGATNSMIPLTKFHDGPDLPPRKDPYNNMTPRNVMATPNAYAFERSDTYTHMNPVGSVFAPAGVPPPQYEACSSFKKGVNDDQLYSEIPGEYLMVQNSKQDGLQPQAHYGNISSAEIQLQLRLSDTEKEDLSTKSDISVQEVYGN